MLLFAVYFGKLPEYTPLWIQSCQLNGTVNWILITDQTISFDLPGNVQVMQMSLGEFRDRLSKFAGFEVCLDSGYRACDFRPLFSTFMELSGRDWDFWGHCDLDVIFGDIRKYMSCALLSKYDRLMGAGHFSIYRNCEASNNWFKHKLDQVDYKNILSQPEHAGFDEHRGVNRLWDHYGGRFFKDETIVADIDPNVSQMTATSTTSYVKNFREQVFYFDNGRVGRLFYIDGNIASEEYMYIHFQKRRFTLPIPNPAVDRYFITPSGFVPWDSSITVTRDLLRSLNPPNTHFSRRETIHRIRHRIRLIKRSVLGAL